MLGFGNVPELLVEVTKETDRGFDFHVVNGAWDGSFEHVDMQYGDVFINYTKATIINVQVLTTNQDRLRGKYEDVFANFYNENYVAPTPVFNIPENWDNDIAF